MVAGLARIRNDTAFERPSIGERHRQTQASNGKGKGHWDAGVTPPRTWAPWVRDYEPRDTDALAAFRITPEPGVEAIEASVAVAGESSAATWSVVWTDRRTAHAMYQAKSYQVDGVPGTDGQYIPRVA